MMEADPISEISILWSVFLSSFKMNFWKRAFRLLGAFRNAELGCLWRDQRKGWESQRKSEWKRFSPQVDCIEHPRCTLPLGGIMMFCPWNTTLKLPTILVQSSSKKCFLDCVSRPLTHRRVTKSRRSLFSQALYNPSYSIIPCPVQRLAISRGLGCMNPASWLPHTAWLKFRQSMTNIIALPECLALA